MMAALSQHKDAALGAATFVTHNVNKLSMSSEQMDTIKTLLGQMQGVLRLACMLCPTFRDDESAMLALGKTHMLLCKHDVGITGSSVDTVEYAS